MRYLEVLDRRGIRASIRRGTTLWLDPHYLVTPDVAEAVRSHKDEILDDIRACAADISSEMPEIVPDYQFLMVATDRDSWEGDDPRFGYPTPWPQSRPPGDASIAQVFGRSCPFLARPAKSHGNARAGDT